MHVFWKRSEIQNQSLMKQMGLYEIESISSATFCTISINPKEYFKKFKNCSVNKKHKEVRKDQPEMNFKCYSERIHPLREIDTIKSIDKKLFKKDFKLKIQK